jgi:hypothetical protein
MVKIIILMIGVILMLWSPDATAQQRLAVGHCVADLRKLCPGVPRTPEDLCHTSRHPVVGMKSRRLRVAMKTGCDASQRCQCDCVDAPVDSRSGSVERGKPHRGILPHVTAVTSISSWLRQAACM